MLSQDSQKGQSPGQAPDPPANSSQSELEKTKAELRVSRENEIRLQHALQHAQTEHTKDMRQTQQQLQQLKKDVIAKHARIEELEKNFRSVESRLHQQDIEVAVYEQKELSAQKEIQALENRIDDLEGKKKGKAILSGVLMLISELLVTIGTQFYTMISAPWLAVTIIIMGVTIALLVIVAGFQ